MSVDDDTPTSCDGVTARVTSLRPPSEHSLNSDDDYPAPKGDIPARGDDGPVVADTLSSCRRCPSNNLSNPSLCTYMPHHSGSSLLRRVVVVLWHTTSLSRERLSFPLGHLVWLERYR